MSAQNKSDDIVKRIWARYLGVNTTAAELAKDAGAEIERLRGLTKESADHIADAGKMVADHHAELEREHLGDPEKRTGIYADQRSDGDALDAEMYRYIKENAPPEGVTVKFLKDGLRITWGLLSASEIDEPQTQQLPPLTDVMYHAVRGSEYTFSGAQGCVMGYLNDECLDEIWDNINTALRCAAIKGKAND